MRTCVTLIGLMIWCFCLCDCATTKSSVLIIPSQASLGSNGPHSDVIRVIYDDNGMIIGQVVGEGWRKRYNQLIVDYGKSLLIPLKADEGLVKDGNYWFAPASVVSEFIFLNEMGHAAKK